MFRPSSAGRLGGLAPGYALVLERASWVVASFARHLLPGRPILAGSILESKAEHKASYAPLLRRCSGRVCRGSYSLTGGAGFFSVGVDIAGAQLSVDRVLRRDPQDRPVHRLRHPVLQQRLLPGNLIERGFSSVCRATPPHLPSEDAEFRPAGDVQLSKDAAHVPTHGIRAERESFSDVGVVHSAGSQKQHLSFPVVQTAHIHQSPVGS